MFNMQYFHKTVKIIIAMFITGVILFSCAIENHNNGTLILKMPGGSNARSVSPDFLDTLTYRIDCEGTASVSRTARAGEAVSIPLAAGEWEVTVTVFNAAMQDIGGETKMVAIEAGKLKKEDFKIFLEKYHCEITEFKIISPPAVGEIQADRIIRVYLPSKAPDVKNMQFTLVHTGKSIFPDSNLLNFSSPQTFTVTPEEGEPKKYFVTVTERTNFFVIEEWSDRFIYPISYMPDIDLEYSGKEAFHSSVKVGYNTEYDIQYPNRGETWANFFHPNVTFVDGNTIEGAASQKVLKVIWN